MVNEFDDPIFRSVEVHSLRADPPFEEALAEVPGDVRYLDCEGVPVAELAPLLAFAGLRVLNISGTKISSLAGIEALRELEILYADFGLFSNLEPLTGLSRLRALDVSCNLADLADVTPLAGIVGLERLYLAHCDVVSIAPIMGSPSLRLLSLAGTAVPEAEIARFRDAHPACELWS